VTVVPAILAVSWDGDSGDSTADSAMVTVVTVVMVIMMAVVTVVTMAMVTMVTESCHWDSGDSGKRWREQCTTATIHSHDSGRCNKSRVIYLLHFKKSVIY
jgi:hypothetical protein